LQHGMTPQRICTIFFGLHLLTSKVLYPVRAPQNWNR
jgi:hypothetical protein